MGEAGAFALFIGLGGAVIALLVGPIGQALARRLSGQKGPPPSTGLSTGEMTAERVAELEQRLGELEEVQARVTQLEERLEFAERLLARSAAVRPELARGESP